MADSISFSDDGDAVAILDKDIWTRRFVAELAMLRGAVDMDDAASIADDCWEWNGWGSPEAAARHHVESVELRARSAG